MKREKRKKRMKIKKRVKLKKEEDENQERKLQLVHERKRGEASDAS